METLEIKINSLKEIKTKVMQHIRNRSRDFYEKELQEELNDFGKSEIDKHAGQGIYIKVILEK